MCCQLHSTCFVGAECRQPATVTNDDDKSFCMLCQAGSYRSPACMYHQLSTSSCPLMWLSGMQATTGSAPDFCLHASGTGCLALQPSGSAMTGEGQIDSSYVSRQQISWYAFVG